MNKFRRHRGTFYFIYPLILFASPLCFAKPGVVKNKSSPFSISSSEKPVNLLELYTSEGCSSCPPADTWINNLRNDHALWKNFVPVVFHVDYWNTLGWVDPFSQAQFTSRQKDYGATWASQSIYTPEFALNGREWRGSTSTTGHNQILEATRGAGTEPRGGLLTARQINENEFELTYVAPARTLTKEYKINGALMAATITSHVTTGENAGSDLKHEFVVLDLQANGLTKKDARFSGHLKFKSGLKPTPASVAFWVTSPGHLPVQAVGSDLSH